MDRSGTVGRATVGLSVDEQHLPDGHLISLTGRLDVRSVPDLRLLMHRVCDTGSEPLLLDLSGCEIGDATGFGLIVESLRRARRRDRVMRVSAADERTRRIIRRARLGLILDAAAPQGGPAAVPG